MKTKSLLKKLGVEKSASVILYMLVMGYGVATWTEVPVWVIFLTCGLFALALLVVELFTTPATSPHRRGHPQPSAVHARSRRHSLSRAQKASTQHTHFTGGEKDRPTFLPYDW